MTEVYCFSGRGHCSAIAAFFAKRLQTGVVEITENVPCAAETAVIVFPVYCQNIPRTVVSFLKRSRAEYAVLIAAYGRISHGNVLWEAASLTGADVIAAAYVPTGHSFLDEGTDFDSAALAPIFEKLAHPSRAKLELSFKDPFADFFPAWRSRVGLKITRTGACDACNLCGESCPVGAIENGKISRRCIRCLRCVTVCPQKALRTEQSGLLKSYLKRNKDRNCDTVVYL